MNFLGELSFSFDNRSEAYLGIGDLVLLFGEGFSVRTESLIFCIGGLDLAFFTGDENFEG